MEFRLIYGGTLKSHGDIKEKHKIRKYFHPQLKELWNQSPLKDYKDYLEVNPKDDKISVIERIGEYQFAPLVTAHLKLISELDIILLRPEDPGRIITSGDIDNRLRTLFDALRCPKNEQEIPTNEKPRPEETPFFCLLQDDALITSVNVICDRLLRNTNPSDVFLLIHVKVKATGVIYGNIGIIG